jgi:hypothetical protein
MPGQQSSFGPGFPPPIGAEQIFGFAPSLPQMSYPSPVALTPAQLYQAGTAPYFAPWSGTVPWHQAGTPFGHSPVIQQVAAQIAPMVQQTLLPYVIGAAWQQVQQQVPQVVAQLVGPYPGLASQQHLTPMAGAGIFGQISRPYSPLF